jgi:hypothetical protein
MKNKNANTQTNMKSWTWYRAWGNTLPIPRTVDGERLLSEGNISLKQALIWTSSVSAIYSVLTTSSSLIKNPPSISLHGIFVLLANSIIAGLLSPIGFVLVTGFIHGISKLFGSKGSWRNFYIIYITFNAPVMIL